MSTNHSPKKKIGLKVFGSVLFFLGMLNIMFFTKAGIELPKFYIFLIFAGIIMFALGSLGDRR
ncbi:MAG: hypothetical protein HZB79_07880 [Deltaproteobacteria bacterium]|nr:hypothetical protein [Deltaproteobacteria bacterium]